MNAANMDDDKPTFRNVLRSYSDMTTDLVERADKAVRDAEKPAATAKTGLYALKLAQMRQALKEGRPEAVREAMEEAGLIDREAHASKKRWRDASALPEVRWFVAQTKPAYEAGAIRSLAEAGFRACAPTEGKWTQVHRKDVIRIRQVFPRYVFVGLVPDENDDIDFRSPRLCDGMAGFVEGAGRRVEVHDAAVGDIMAASEMHWIEAIAEKARVEAKSAAKGMSRKRLRTEGVTNEMADILEADPVNRMRMFIERFGVKSDLHGIERRAIAET